MPSNMLSESDLAAIKEQTDSFKSANEARRNTLQAILKQHHDLIDAYRSLKAELEAAREAAKNTQADGIPFVLVLVDGDDYIFQKEFLTACESGSRDVAQSIRRSVLQSFPRLKLDRNACRIIVKIYLDLDGTTRRLARLAITSPETRSLAAFAADFNTEEMFEIVDTGPKRADMEAKIRGCFHLFADDMRCKHIFFAGCQRKSYLSLVEPYGGMTKKVSLITAGCTPLEEYRCLNLPLLGFSNVFCTLADADKVYSFLECNYTCRNYASAAFEPVHQAIYKGRFCVFHAQGMCNLGENCSFSHNPELKRPIYSNEQVFKMSTDKARLIPVNKYGGRLDPELPPVSTKTEKDFRARIAQGKKICHFFHLIGQCHNNPCPYDHDPVPEDILQALRLYIRSKYCMNGELCRKLQCSFRHTCERVDCKGCSLKKSVHGFREDNDQIAGWALALNQKKPHIPEEEEIDEPVDDSAGIDGGLQLFGSSISESVSSDGVRIEASDNSNGTVSLAEEEDLIDLS